MGFRYYITDTFNGCIKGTDNTKEAENFALCEEYFVVDTESGEWITPDSRIKIEEVKEGE